MDALKPGDVVIVNLEGAVETKRRPMVVISTEKYQQEHPDVIVGVVTSNLGIADTETDCLLQDWAAAGLRGPSAFRTYLTTEWERDITKRIGQLSERDWSAVKACVRRALDVD